jgi:Ca2+-binding EF-hand superfamily protein
VNGRVEAKQPFDKLDLSGNGKIEMDELHQVMAANPDFRIPRQDVLAEGLEKED